MSDDRIIQVPIRAIHAHPRNAEFFDDADPESFARLKESIAEVGMLTPIRVSKDYTIISGHQRYRACTELGVEFVGVIVDTELDDENEMLMQLIVSNFGRAKNDPVKQGKMIEEYEQLCGITHGGARRGVSTGNNSRLKTQEELAKEFGCDVTTLRNLKRLAKLPVEVQEVIRAGRISPTTAVKSLASLSVEDQLKVIASLPEAKSRFTQAAVQAQIDKLRTTAIERDQAQEQATEAKAIAQQLQRDADAMLEIANESIRSLQSQLNEAKQQLLTKPEQVEVMPADYAEIKQKAAQVHTLEHDVEVLRDKLAKAEARLNSEPAEDTHDSDDCLVGPSITIDKINRGLLQFRPPVQDLLDNPDLIQKLEPGVKRPLAAVLFDLADEIHQLVRKLNTSSGFTY